MRALSPQSPPGHALPGPPAAEVERVVRQALAEDLGPGDVTSELAVPAAARARARLVAKAHGVLAGLDAFVCAFELCDPEVRVQRLCADGERLFPGRAVAVVEGLARGLLAAERTALNLLQRLSGVATRTAGCVALLADLPGVRLFDTRKTTPGLRVLEKYAVLCGGGHNHRAGLWDEALLKENHLALSGRGLLETVRELRAALAPGVRLHCEATNADEARDAVRGGADVVLLDNFTAAELEPLCTALRQLAAELPREVELEASGGITEETLRAVAASGVDRISMGALTHSAPALDLSLYLEPLPADGAG